MGRWGNPYHTENFWRKVPQIQEGQFNGSRVETARFLPRIVYRSKNTRERLREFFEIFLEYHELMTSPGFVLGGPFGFRNLDIRFSIGCLLGVEKIGPISRPNLFAEQFAFFLRMGGFGGC